MLKRGARAKREEVIWSSEIAYAVGLIATDGNLSSDKRHIELTSKDREQLVNFQKAIGREVVISTKKSGFTGKEVSRIQFSDVTLYKFFESVGLTTKKTLTMGRLNIPDEYFFDFLRGHHDGDGSFYSYYDPRWKKSFMFYLIFISASPAHVLWTRESLERILGVRGHIGTSKSSKVQQLKYGKKEALLVLKRMYRKPDDICLKRKRLKILEALRIVGESLW